MLRIVCLYRTHVKQCLWDYLRFFALQRYMFFLICASIHASSDIKRTILYLISPDSMDVSTRCLSAKRIHIIKGCRIFGVWCKIRRHCAIYEGFCGFWVDLEILVFSRLQRKCLCCAFFWETPKEAPSRRRINTKQAPSCPYKAPNRHPYEVPISVCSVNGG